MATSPTKPARIAIVTELEWPLKRHYEIIKGIQDYASAHENWELEVTRFPEVLMESGVHFDGLIGRIPKDTYFAAKKSGIPMVNVMIGSGALSSVPSVIVDMYAAGRMAAEHLINRGMRRLIAVREGGQRSSKFVAEAVEALAGEHNIPYRSCTLPFDTEVSSENWRIARQTVLETIGDWKPPVGLVTNTDMNAQIIITLIRDMGWTVPTDLAFVSMGNQDIICTVIQPTLSSVDLNYDRNGYEAARLMGELLRGGTAPKDPIMVSPKRLVARGSSDVYAVGDPDVQKALRFIADNSHKPVSVKDITAATDVCRQTLERRFRKQLNTSIYNELTRLRIERAKRLLVEELDIPIKNLGPETGFTSRSNFFEAFKKQTGMSPSQYRDTFSDPDTW